jgi:hypothetical protein
VCLGHWDVFSYCHAAPGSQTPSWRPPKARFDDFARLQSLCRGQQDLGRWQLEEGYEVEKEDVGIVAWQVS